MASHQIPKFGRLFVGCTLASAVLLLPLGGGLSAASATPSGVQVVFPTGQYPADVLNVQAAVDRGGTVRLKATNAHGVPTDFNFGSYEHEGEGSEVRLAVSVKIFGESRDGNMTTIRGGWLPLFGIAHTHTVVAGINFEGQGLSAMVFIASSGAVIRGNRVAGVVGTPLPPEWGGLLEGRGIKFLGNNDPAGAITGTVIVADNVIEHMDAGVGDGIVFDSVAADVRILGNRVAARQSSGVLMLNGSGHVTISHNRFVVQPGNNFYFGNGVGIAAGLGGSYAITDNRIIADDLLAEGIFLQGLDDPAFGGPIEELVLGGNNVSLRGSAFGGISLLGDVSNGIAVWNRVEGDGAYAVDLLNDGSTAPTRNRFIGIDLTGFRGATSDVFLDEGSARNVVIGRLGDVLDFGTHNVVVDLGVKPSTPAAADSARITRADKYRSLESIAHALDLQSEQLLD